MFSRMFTLAALASAAGLASSQSISATCTSALTSIATNPDASACLDPSALLSLFIGSSNTSVIGPITNWLTSVCAAAPCSNATLSAVVTNVTSGCSAELGASSNGSLSSILPIVQEVYPTVRNVLCLKDNSANQLCVPEVLTGIQSVVGTLSITELTKLFATSMSSNFTLPPNVTCTNCVKEAYNLVNQAAPSLASEVGSDLQSQCGSSFTNGSTPSDISLTASNSSTSTSASAKPTSAATPSLTSHVALAGIAVSMLVVISTAFTFLA